MPVWTSVRSTLCTSGLCRALDRQLEGLHKEQQEGVAAQRRCHRKNQAPPGELVLGWSGEQFGASFLMSLMGPQNVTGATEYTWEGLHACWG